jgi:hypothetical protein
MLKMKYVVTVDLGNTIHVFRQLKNALSERSLPPLPSGLNRDSPECAAQLALALLNDCLSNEARVLRLHQPFADLLVSPLLLRVNWILSNEDIEDAVRAIEEREGWLWLEDGYYLDLPLSCRWTKLIETRIATACFIKASTCTRTTHFSQRRGQ